MTKQEKLEKIAKDIEKTKDKMKEIAGDSFDSWADGGDGWHDEQWRLLRNKYQIYDAHLKSLKRERVKIMKAS